MNIKNKIAEHKKFFSDFKHIFWLFRRMVKNFLKGNLGACSENWFWIKMHWNYKSVKIKQCERGEGKEIERL